MENAPIILFTYNRLLHTKRTIEALRKNELAGKSMLIIYSDGNKNDYDTFKVKELRDFLKTVDGFKEIRIIERKQNLGLAMNIIQGVTEVINKYDKVIVLEDDIVVFPGFLKFMNSALNIYQNEQKVMNVSGYFYPADVKDLPDTFLLKQSACWGWATWERAWTKFERDVEKTMKSFSKKQIHEFNVDGKYNFWNQLRANRNGEINTWAIFWYSSCFLSEGLTLFPKFSFTQNIGHDDSGVHCATNHYFDVQLKEMQEPLLTDVIAENIMAKEALKKYFMKIHPPFYRKISNIFKKIFL